jgi:hypothetical protein
LHYAAETMNWIKTISLSEASEPLLRALESQRALHPKEYASPVFATDDGVAGIVGSHTPTLCTMPSPPSVSSCLLTCRLLAGNRK